MDNQETLHETMRRLWTDHVYWTRIWMDSTLAGMDARWDLARLLRNQDEIGTAIGQVYGDAAGRRAAALLRAHILGAALVVMAAAHGDQAALERAVAAWRHNADQFAVLLSSLNPRVWSRAELRRAFYYHLDLTIAEASARIQGDKAGDIAAFDRVLAHIVSFADMLSDGIAGQFPRHFGY